ncbi:M20 family metallopeptidase [Halomarina litorea]|uniref:M20 family metallopeptidase n=1 Tax=Halomarina litorea TaxID=2961595 RepID=UPI0020C517FD|nr:M20 family metallopeptidase [Halomarina sp. BCD28]
MSFDPLAFHERAVRTPSHESVDGMRDLLVGTLDENGADPRVDGAGNVLASTGEGDFHLVLNTHLDTVPPHVPFSRDGDTVRGRGACDAKGPLATLVDAFLAADPDYRLTLAVTPDEETTSAGADALSLDGDAYIVGEPTGLDVCTAARGRFEGAVTIRGEAGHAAHPESGVNAVAGAEGVLRALRTFDAEHGPGTHDQLGGPTLTPTGIAGGEAINQIPAACRVDVDRRSVPPETAEGFETALNDHLAATAPDVDATFALTERETPFLEAFATDPDDSLVAAFEGAGAGDVRPFGAATEASYFAPAPTVVFGPGVLSDEVGPVAHAEREYVSRAEVEEAATILGDVLAAF